MRRAVASLAVLLAIFGSGCAAPPAAVDPAQALPVLEPSQDWIVVRDFSFVVKDGVVVPVVGSSHTSYEGLLVACGMFELPDSLRRLTLWLNSTPDDLAAGQVGGVTFDLRHDDPSATLGYNRLDPQMVGVRSYALVVEDPPATHYLVNFKAEQVTLNGHAEGRYILEGTGLYEDGEVPGIMKDCKK